MCYIYIYGFSLVLLVWHTIRQYNLPCTNLYILNSLLIIVSTSNELQPHLRYLLAHSMANINTVVLLAVGFVTEHVHILITIKSDDLQQFNVVPFQQHTHVDIIRAALLAHMGHHAQIKTENCCLSTSHYMSAMNNLFHKSSEMDFIVRRRPNVVPTTAGDVTGRR